MNSSKLYQLVWTILASTGATAAWAQTPPLESPISELASLPPENPPPSIDLSKLQPREIALWGQILSFDATTGELELQTAGFEVFGGRKATFAYFKPKTVRLSPDAQWLGSHGQPLPRTEVKSGHWVYVVGINEGTGTPLNARLLRDSGEEPPRITAPLLTEKPLSKNKKQVIKSAAPPKPPVALKPLIPPPPATALMTLADVSPWLRTVASAFPDQVQILPLAVTVGGRTVLALQIAPPDIPIQNLRRLAVICRQHGDEPETTAAGVEFIHRLLASRTARSLRLRRQVAVLVVPVANPDGAWRKRRHNAAGQDLNRDWENERSREISSLNSLLLGWQPHLIVDVHQWVPGDSTQTPMAEASGGLLGRRVAAAMTSAARAKGLRLAYRTHGVGGSLCHRYWGARGVPSILLETVHRPKSPSHRKIAIETTVIALQRTLDILAG